METTDPYLEAADWASQIRGRFLSSFLDGDRAFISMSEEVNDQVQLSIDTFHAVRRINSLTALDAARARMIAERGGFGRYSAEVLRVT